MRVVRTVMPGCIAAGILLALWPCASATGDEPPAGNPAAHAPGSQHTAYEQYALTHEGDLTRGRELFLEEKRTRCSICHKLDGQGGEAGPDLTHIGGKFDRAHLIEALLQPSRQIVEGFRSSTVVTVAGKAHHGILRKQDETQITLVEANGEPRNIRREQIEALSDNPVSLMPEGLAKELSLQEFTDLIAYLESLRPKGNRFGAGIAGPVSLPRGFDVRTIATGLTGATAIDVLPDGRVLVCEQTRAVRVVENGKLLETPLVKLPVEAYWERGVIGVTHDPEFPREPYVYVCWVAKEPYPHHRVSRFQVSGNIAEPESELTLLTGDDQTQMGGKVPAGHQGGALHFGNDGKLYIGIGEQTAGLPSQRLDTFLGKILRINPDGSIPPDNPFVTEAKGKYRAIWARGCRNPFTFAIRPSDGLMLINDVGGQFEEINIGRAGANYGWPVVEHGDRREYEQDQFQGPIHWYPQSSIGGGDFCRNESDWPADWRGRYFFADFVQGWIKSIDPEDPGTAETFATGLRRPVDLRFAPDGSLYVLLRNAWVIDDKFSPGTGSLLQIRYVGAAAEIPAANATADVVLTENAIDESAGGLSAYRIQTPSATYYLEKSGAGLSSLVDRDGYDWIGFHPEPGSAAGGEYRGFPNAVHQQAGNYFHPKNAGTDPSVTRVDDAGPERVTITAESGNGLWACRYDFFPTHCTFAMTRMPSDKHYWVLYEGTPAGQFDQDDWWITSEMRNAQPLTQRHKGDIAAPEWIAFGDKRLQRVVYLFHHQDDRHPDDFYAMQQKMTVFGFGRRGLEKFLRGTPQQFSIGFIDSTDHGSIDREIAQRHRDVADHDGTDVDGP